MKIRRLHIKNLRLIRDLELDFTDPVTGDVRNWTVIIAENGRGKSSVLQSIALAAAGKTLANSLAGGQIPSFSDRRIDTPAATEIGVEFDLPEVRGLGFKKPPPRECPGANGEPTRLAAYLKVQPGGSTLAGQSWYGELGPRWSDAQPDGEPAERPPPTLDDPLDLVRSELRPWWFVVGYGIDRRLQIEPQKLRFPESVQRLSSLFWPDVPGGISFADRNTYPKLASPFVTLLNKVLRSHPALTPMVRRLELRGHGGASARDIAEREKTEVELPGGASLKLPANYLSHGYQSTLAWLADLVGQYLLDFQHSRVPFKTLSPNKLSGLVLIDELDLFLHPKWQIDFIEALSATFPNLQFIATTHSPLLISKLRPDQLVVLDWDERGDIGPIPFDGDPRLMTATDLYRALFDIEDAPPDDTLFEQVFRYESLARDAHRSEAEDREMRSLRHALDEKRVALRIEPVERRR